MTGGGSQLAHTKQLIEYVTGIDTRIGFPGEHLASGLVNEVNSPMYATGTGLVVHGLEAPDFNGEETPLQEKTSRREKVSKDKTEAEKQPYTNFIYKIKEWFENSMSNTTDFIE